jgi:hypothetical protein
MNQPLEILNLAARVKKALSGVFKFRAVSGLDIEQVLIYLALGSMNLEGSHSTVVTMQSNCRARQCGENCCNLRIRNWCGDRRRDF